MKKEDENKDENEKPCRREKRKNVTDEEDDEKKDFSKRLKIDQNANKFEEKKIEKEQIICKFHFKKKN